MAGSACWRGVACVGPQSLARGYSSAGGTPSDAGSVPRKAAPLGMREERCGRPISAAARALVCRLLVACRRANGAAGSRPPRQGSLATVRASPRETPTGPSTRVAGMTRYPCRMAAAALRRCPAAPDTSALSPRHGPCGGAWAPVTPARGSRRDCAPPAQSAAPPFSQGGAAAADALARDSVGASASG